MSLNSFFFFSEQNQFDVNYNDLDVPELNVFYMLLLEISYFIFISMVMGRL